MQVRSVCLLFASLVVTIASVTGCGGSSMKSYNVSGDVTFDGAPLPRGTIQFLPDAAKGNKGPAGFANVVDGKFDTKTSGKGTVGGPHKVVISGFDGKADPSAELLLGNQLFGDYRTDADLPMEDGTQNFDVPKSATAGPQRSNYSEP